MDTRDLINLYDSTNPSENEFFDIAKIHPEEYFAKCNIAELLDKESLGILKIDQLNASFSCDIVNTSSNTCKTLTNDNSEVPNNPLISLSREFPSNSSPLISSFPYNSCSLEENEFSHILSSKSEVFHNSAFGNTSSCIKFNLLNGSKTLFKQNDIVQCRSSLNGNDSFYGVDDDVLFNSVLDEAKDLATKFAEGSNLICVKYDDEVLLDSITPPQLFETVEIEEKQCNLEIVLKENVCITEGSPNCNDEVSCVSTSTTNNKEEKFKEHLNSIFNNSRRRSNSASCSSASGNPKELLTNLYSIITCERRDEKQNEECHELLLGLANILCSKDRCDDLDNFEQVSTEPEGNEHFDDFYCKALDLRINKSDIENRRSFAKSKKNEKKRLSRSFTVPSQPKVLNSKWYDPESSSLNSFSDSKLKPKKPEAKAKKVSKGPLKAVIPLTDMSKRNKILGEKFICTVGTPQRLKFADSPISDSRLKPMAQSTPNAAPSVVERSKMPRSKKYTESPVQNSDEFNSIGSTKSSQSASTPNLSNRSGLSRKDSFIPSPKFIYRRHSATELKTTEEQASFALNRTIAPTSKHALVNKLKHAVSFVGKNAVKNATSRSNQTPQMNSRSALNESGNTSGIIKNMKSLSLLGKNKKSKDGKENLRKN